MRSPLIAPHRRPVAAAVSGVVALAGVMALAGIVSGAIAPTPALASTRTRPAAARTAPVLTRTAPVLVRTSPALTLTGTGTYVALGDSMPAGPLIPVPVGPLACARSTRNYPHDLARRLGSRDPRGPRDLRDVTCSGASTRHMTEPQNLSVLGTPAGTAPPQFDALSADTTLVTLTIGGNDTGLVGVAENCVRLDPAARPCRDDYTSGGVDRVAQRIDAFEPKLSAVLDGIRERAPKARVVVTGYGLYMKPHGCWPVQPVLAIDADYLQGSVERMNDVIERQALAHGDTYVDLVTPGAGHDMCQVPSRRWVEGYVPLNPAAPLHPNQRGEAAYARIIARAITSRTGTGRAT